MKRNETAWRCANIVIQALTATVRGCIDKGSPAAGCLSRKGDLIMKHKVPTGWFRPGRKAEKDEALITMICLEHDCGNLWDAQRAGGSCTKCGSKSVIPANKWNLDKQGVLRLGRVAS